MIQKLSSLAGYETSLFQSHSLVRNMTAALDQLSMRPARSQTIFHIQHRTPLRTAVPLNPITIGIISEGPIKFR